MLERPLPPLPMRAKSAVLVLTLVAALAASAAACKRSSAGSAKLEGRWRGTRADGVTAPEAQLPATVFATGTEIIARGNQIAVTTPSGKPQQATYFVDSEEKNSVVIHTDKDGPAARETFMFSDDGKTMMWRIDERRSIVFQRIAN